MTHPNYTIYLLTVWFDGSENASDPSNWRFRLENPRTKEAKGYVGVEALANGMVERVRRENTKRVLLTEKELSEGNSESMNTDIPNLRLRHFAGESDYAHIAAVLNACGEVTPTGWTETAENVANRYAHLVNCDLSKDMIIAEVDGEMVGYSRSEWLDAPETGRIYLFSLLIRPTWQDKGISKLFLHWMENHLRQVAKEHGLTQRAYLQSYVESDNVEQMATLTEAGFQPKHHSLFMLRPTLEVLPQAQLPDGLELRPAIPETYRMTWEMLEEIDQDRSGYLQLTEEHYQAWTNDKLNFQPELWQVAWDIATNQIAGAVTSTIDPVENAKFDRKRAYIIHVGVRRPWRHKGLARALIIKSLHTHKSAGMSESVIGFDSLADPWVLPHLARHGFQKIDSSVVYQRPLVV